MKKRTTKRADGLHPAPLTVRTEHVGTRRFPVVLVSLVCDQQSFLAYSGEPKTARFMARQLRTAICRARAHWMGKR